MHIKTQRHNMRQSFKICLFVCLRLRDREEEKDPEFDHFIYYFDHFIYYFDQFIY